MNEALNMFIIEFRYNAHSDWMKNHVLSDCKTRSKKLRITPPPPPPPIYWFSRSKSCISGLKIHIKKNTQLGRESSNECSAFFLWTRKAFSHKIVFRGIQRRFSSSRRSTKCPVFKFNQGNKFLKTFQVHFFYSIVLKIHLKSELRSG